MLADPVLAASAPPLLVQLTALVVVGAGIAYVSQRVGTVPIVGFLLAGIVIGPSGLGLVSDTQIVDQTAEIGVLLLLFTIGLELSLGQLRSMGRLLVLGGLLQVGFTVALVVGILAAAGEAWQTGIYTGFLVALSSTAIVLKLLADRGETSSPRGQVAVSLLIFQDLAIVAMVLLVPMLGEGGGTLLDVARALGTATALVVAVVVVARVLLPPLIEAVARICSPEVFLLTVVGICFGTAYLTSLFDVSVSLGAFLAGLVVSESRFRSRALGEVLPLQILFSATFFVSIGMLLDLRYLGRNLLLVAAVALGVLAVKVLATAGATALVGRRTPVVVSSALLLAQIGEFSFVLERAGQDAGLSVAGLGDDGSQLFIAVTVVLMTITPWLAQMGPRLAQRRGRPMAGGREVPAAEAPGDGAPAVELADHVIVAGYGPHAAALVGALEMAGAAFVVVTVNPRGADHADALGRRVLIADPVRAGTLEQAGYRRARALVVLDDEPADAARIVEVARTLRHDVPILARTRAARDVGVLEAAGATAVASDQRTVDDLVARRVLRLLGADEEATERTLAAAHDRAPATDGGQAPADIGGSTIDVHQPVAVAFGDDACEHAADVDAVWPSAAGCEECLLAGESWVHLRICLTCGSVGCCDSSPNRHASAHSRGAGHPVVQSAEPGERWAWCYVDDHLMTPRSASVAD